MKAGRFTLLTQHLYMSKNTKRNARVEDIFYVVHKVASCRFITYDDIVNLPLTLCVCVCVFVCVCCTES